MVIRPIVRQDKDKILPILKQRGTFNEKEIQVALEVIDEGLRMPGGNDYHIFCACEDSGELAGYICYGPIPMTDYCYDLYWIAVDERVSRRGVGEGLLRFMEESVGKKGAKKIYVETSSTALYEAARSFYKKHGYGVVSILTDFYRDGDDKIVFMKNIPASTLAKADIAYAAGPP